jgi:hypothetical protein
MFVNEPVHPILIYSFKSKINSIINNTRAKKKQSASVKNYKKMLCTNLSIISIVDDDIIKFNQDI